MGTKIRSHAPPPKSPSLGVIPRSTPKSVMLGRASTPPSSVIAVCASAESLPHASAPPFLKLAIAEICAVADFVSILRDVQIALLRSDVSPLTNSRGRITTL